MTRRRSGGAAQAASARRAPGPTEAGWSFYSCALTCWRKWFLQYYEGWQPVLTEQYFVLGAVYHALHEGVPKLEIAAWGEQYRDALPEAEALYAARLSASAPPLPHDELGREVECEAFGGLFTSRPDRIEQDADGKAVRDYKTAATFRDSDGEKWAVDGEIIGEMVASKIPRAVVDIIRKGEKGNTVRQIGVVLTPKKEAALKHIVMDTQRQVLERVERLEREWENPKGLLSRNDIAEREFPRSLPHCVHGNELCRFYNLCWGEGATQFLYRRKPNLAWRKRLGVDA